MSFDWNAQFGSLNGSAVFEGAAVSHFGPVDAELRAAASATVVAPLGHLGLIACSSEDAASFLHNQLTSDVTHLAGDQAQHSAWCTAKGRMIASFLVFRRADTYFLQLADELVAPVAKRLQMFVLRSKVKVSDVSTEFALIGLAGPRAEAVLVAAGLPVPAEPMRTTGDDACRVVRIENQRFELAVERAQAAALWATLATAAKPVGIAAWRWLDIKAGVPTITAATREEFVPQMANFDQLGGISFHKGCYPGQEVVARTQYLGKVKRHLYRLVGNEEMAAGMPIYSPATPEQACGQVVNAAPNTDGGSIALVVLQENAAGTEVRLRSPDGPPLSGVTLVASSPVAN